MSLRSLQHILGLVELHDSARHQFQQLTAVWGEVVGEAIAAQTRPVAIQRQVLQVATSNSVWSQTLAFERVRILDRLNAQLAMTLTDIRFSPRQWQIERPAVSTSTALLFQAHPCRIEATEAIEPLADSTPTTAFQHWTIAIQTRSQHLPLCPACHCPTPAGELQRWSVCTHCVVKQW